MKMWTQAAVAGLGLAAGIASADTLELSFVQIAGGGGAATVELNGSGIQAGHLVHAYASGSKAGQQFATFCIEVAQTVGGTAVYNIVELTQAPVPGAVKYTQSQADMVNAIVANAAAMGWIDNRLQADAGQTNYLGRMGAIQAAIWEALGESIDLNSAATSASLASAYNELMDAQSFNPSLRINGLRALVNAQRQDLLYVVPLPPAAFAGLGMLGACFGVRAVRRR
ncbi:MAG: hypothetical protein LAT64_04595 [Phycisphaerales bacterium]|nr:hypothetical protein [Planctomycetota bacterium]MCH8508032.1 hypothetical protein [Phycisphaerales bacterium]